MADDPDDSTPPRPRRHRSQPGTRDQLDDLADAVPGEVPDEEFTKPVAIELSPEAAFLNDRIDRMNARWHRGRRKTADQITEAMGARPPNERLTSLETRLKLVIAVLAAVASLAAGAAVTVAKGLYERGENDGEMQIRLRNLERAVDQIQQRSGFPYTPLSPLSKGNPAP